MKVDDSGWLDDATKRPTHKQSHGFEPEFILTHYTVGSAASAVHAFTKGARKVSAHLLVDRGGAVTQFVPFSKRAWHAGRSTWEDRTGCNGFMIGIEFENVGPLHLVGSGFRDVYERTYSGGVVEEQQGRYRYWAAYTSEQIERGQEIVHALLDAYPKIRRVLGHSDVSPGRKIDPGPAFPLETLDDLCDERGDRDSDEGDEYTVTTALNMRSGPGMGYRVLDVLAKGTQVTPKARDGLWWLVKSHDSADGWVYSKYLTPVD